jgi:hypothetical protein
MGTMAMSKTCSICAKPVKSRDLCAAHLHRLVRHGDPLGGGIRNGEAGRFYRDVVLQNKDDACLLWPYSRRNGYGQLYKDGRTHVVSRLACQDVYGLPPTPTHEAAHSCGNGHLGCVNPKHLSWKTPVENHADKLIHGTRSRGEKHGAAKLTEADVVQIRSMRGTRSLREIAAQFGVSRSAVSQIHLGNNWGHTA